MSVVTAFTSVVLAAEAQTIVYVHGLTQDDEYVPHDAAQPISQLLADDFRVCLYDRRNSGDSDTVDAVQTPADMLHDMETVLANGDLEPPYILMAASFGGLVAYDFLNHHPEEVSGLVLLDAMIPDELSLDEYLPPDATFQYYSEDDKCCMPERISGYDLISSMQQYIGDEPDVPMIYLGAALAPRVEYDWVTPEYAARYPAVLQGFVNRFSPGELRWVDATHFMEREVPDQIAQAVRDVAELASTR